MKFARELARMNLALIALDRPSAAFAASLTFKHDQAFASGRKNLDTRLFCPG